MERTRRTGTVVAAAAIVAGPPILLGMLLTAAAVAGLGCALDPGCDEGAPAWRAAEALGAVVAWIPLWSVAVALVVAVAWRRRDRRPALVGGAAGWVLALAAWYVFWILP